MKYLSDYTEKAQTALFERLGVFFAFDDKQYEEGKAKYGHLKPEGTKWTSIGMGMYLPSVNVDEFSDSFKLITEAAIKQDLAENGRSGVLQRELGNYEIGLCGYGCHDLNFRDAIRDYGFTEEEIKAEYNKHMEEHEY